ncbi:TPA: hypothetical protein ACOTHO_002797 [Clostridium perfringens]|uniref:hypothetical protein n=1 Tax=Clostridium perfringens TaxID=1502 RepID=UPI0032DB9A9E|nr:hypothetical protein [Clostridium perfringens]MDM0716858.1 hypothetical protein [Clostridium perfringens]
MNKEINLNDVLEFIKKYGYKYNCQIQRELDKIKKIFYKAILEKYLYIYICLIKLLYD